MRIDGPGGSWRVEMRGESELTGADRRALEAVDDMVTGLDKGVWFGDDGSEFQLSADGTSLIPRVARRMVSRETIALARDTMLARLITGWTWEDKLPMPYHTGYLDSDELPILAVEKIDKVLDDVMSRLRSGGPKEKPGTTATSTSTSPGSSPPPQPASALTTAVPASGSPATAA